MVYPTEIPILKMAYECGLIPRPAFPSRDGFYLCIWGGIYWMVVAYFGVKDGTVELYGQKIPLSDPELLTKAAHILASAKNNKADHKFYGTADAGDFGEWRGKTLYLEHLPPSEMLSFDALIQHLRG